jgi:hypothetical protein
MDFARPDVSLSNLDQIARAKDGGKSNWQAALPAAIVPHDRPAYITVVSTEQSVQQT